MRTVVFTMALSNLGLFTAVSEATSGPATYLKHPQPNRKYIAPNLSGADVTVDLTAALAAYQTTGISSYRYVLPLYWNVTRAATHELFIASTVGALSSSGTSARYVSGNFWKSMDNDLGRFPRRHSWIDLGEQRTEPWLRYKVTDATNPRGQIEGGILLIHPGYSPSGLIAQNPKSGAQQPGLTFQRSISGAERGVAKPIERIKEVVLQATGVNSRAELEDNWVGLQETVGLNLPVAMLLDADATTRTMNAVIYGKLMTMQQVVLAEYWNLAQMQLGIKESL